MISGEIRWTFHGYESRVGNPLVQEWFDALPESAQDALRDHIGYLAVLPVEAWCRPPFAPLDEGLSEIRAKDTEQNKHYRIYGFFWPEGRFQYTLLHGTDKKVSNDKRGKRDALNRMKQVRRGEVRIHEFNFEKESD